MMPALKRSHTYTLKRLEQLEQKLRDEGVDIPKDRPRAFIESLLFKISRKFSRK